MNSIDAWRHLQRIAGELSAGRLPAERDRTWLLMGVAQYEREAARGRRLDACLGLFPNAGVIPWWERQGDLRRLQLLTELWLRLDGTPHRKAKAIEFMAARYERRHQRIDGKSDLMPPEYAGKVEEILWRLHRCGARWPLKWRQIQEICLQSRAVAAANESGAGSPAMESDQPTEAESHECTIPPAGLALACDRRQPR